MLLASKRAADLGPEHKHFKVIEARDKGNDKVKCVYCSHEMVGGATRMRAHLLKHRGVGCTPCTGDIPEAVHAEMQQAEDEAQACKLKKQKAAAVDAATRSVASSAAASSSRQSTIKEAVKRADKSSCDAALSKALDFLSPSECARIHTRFNKRWEQLHSPLHAAGYVLDPEFLSHQQHPEEVMEGFLQVVERMLPDPHDQQLVMEQLTRFRAQEGIFARAVVREGAKTMPAHAWWSLYGGGYPELQRVAIRVLSQVISASASERNWSTYGFIHSKSRNRLQPARANKLVYVHSNLRLLDRTSGVSYEEQFPVWDFESEDEA